MIEGPLMDGISVVGDRWRRENVPATGGQRRAS
ncbi:hypothetical protein ACLBOM_34205 [Escherichia coli]